MSILYEVQRSLKGHSQQTSNIRYDFFPICP